MDNFNKNLDSYIEDLLNSYNNYQLKNNEKIILPSKTKIIEILQDIKALLFPKYFLDDYISSSTIKYAVGNLFTKIHKELSIQIKLAILSIDSSKQNDKNLDIEIEEICHKFFKSLPKINELLAKDITSTFLNDPAAESKPQIIFSYPGIFAISTYRIAHELKILNVPIIPRIMSEYAHSITGIDIHPGAEIGENFFIDHGTGIVIGETSIIGDNVRIYQGVTLGAKSIKERESSFNKKRHPTVENNVTLYANVTILGGDTIIGENSIIGGGCFITNSIPKNSKIIFKQ